MKVLIVFYIAILLSLPPAGFSAERRAEADPSLTAPPSTLGPVEVTATRLTDVKERPTEISAKVVVISKEEIAELGAKTVQEVLQYQSGIVMYDSIGNEFQETVDLRGFNGTPVPGVTVFYDGVRINEPDFNAINFDLIPVEDIEQIEIIYGPGTVFGSNALAGVINITTAHGAQEKLSFGGETAGGSYGRQRYRFRSRGKVPETAFTYNLGVTRELSSGYRHDTDSRITRIYSSMGYSNESGTDMTLSYTRVDDNLKQAGTATREELDQNRHINPTPGDFTDNEVNLVSLNLRQSLSHGFSVAMNGFYRGRENKILTRGRPFAPDLPPTEFLGRNSYDQGGAAFQLTHTGNVFGRTNRLNFGVDYRQNYFTGRITRDFTANNVSRENAVGVFFVDTLGIFDSLSISGGLRYDWDQLDFNDRITPPFSFDKTFDQVSPKAGVIYNPLDNLGFYFNFSEGFRTPTASEFQAFGPPPAFMPFVTDLTPVRSRNFEVGARWKLPPWLEGSLSLFYMPVRDEILFVVTDPATFTGQNVNISRTLRRGVEIMVRGRYGPWLDGFLNYTVTKATFETDVLLFSGQVRKGDELPLVPRHRLGFGINMRPIDGLTVSLAGTYVGSQFLLNDEPNQFPKLDDYFVLNSRIAYTWRKWGGTMTSFITINNMTNAEYETFGIVGSSFGVPAEFFAPAPTTTVFAGVQFQFDVDD